MQQGSIRRHGSSAAIGRWVADAHTISVETDDRELREAVDRIVATPQVIPVHGAERFEVAGPADLIVRTPSTVQLIALFALELESRGFEVFADED